MSKPIPGVNRPVRMMTANFSDGSKIQIPVPKGANHRLIEKALHRSNKESVATATKSLTSLERKVVFQIIEERDRRVKLAEAAKIVEDAKAATAAKPDAPPAPHPEG